MQTNKKKIQTANDSCYYLKKEVLHPTTIIMLPSKSIVVLTGLDSDPILFISYSIHFSLIILLFLVKNYESIKIHILLPSFGLYLFIIPWSG